MSRICARHFYVYEGAMADKVPHGAPTAFRDLPDVLTVVEVAGVLRIGRNAAYEAIQRGQIPCVRLGRRVLVPKAALMEMIGIGPVAGDGER
jgi:excisionase family DNA binding protein